MGHLSSYRLPADEFVRAVTSDQQAHNHVRAAASHCAPPFIIAWESLKQDGAWLDVPDFGNPTDGREPLAH